MHSISSQYFLALVSTWEAMGIPREDIISNVTDNIHELKNPRYRIPIEQLEAILNLAAVHLNMPNIGLETAYKFRLMTIGDTPSILNYCNSLADAAHFNSKYSSLAETIGAPALRVRDDGSFVVWTEGFSDHDRFRHVTELIVGGYIITTNWLCWCFEKRLKSVSFRHTAPAEIDRYREICLCPVKFGQTENAIEMFPEFVHRPLPSANPNKLARIQVVLDGVLESASHQSPLEIKSFAAIEAAINNNALSTKNIAFDLGMSERTFRRRLAAKGLTYRNIVDRVRQTMCRTQMQRGKSFTEIAQILGYNDQSAFTRAFRNWYGTPPGQYQEIKFTI